MINLLDATFLHVTTEFNADLALDSPPAYYVPEDDADPALVDLLRVAGQRAARKYDMYATITHIASMFRDEPIHRVLLQDDDAGIATANQDAQTLGYELRLYTDECALMIDFWSDSLLLSTSMLIGWDIHRQLAMLVTKALHYGISVPERYKHNPLKRYSTVECLLDVQQVYLQGLSPAVRSIPDFNDGMDYFGETDFNKPLPLSERRATTAHDALEWMNGDRLRCANARLAAMKNLLRRYYDHGTDMPVMRGASTAEGIRGPMPQATGT